MGNEKNPGYFQIGIVKKNIQENLLDYDINVTMVPRGKNALWASAISPSGQVAAIGGSRMAMIVKGIDNNAECVSDFYGLKSDVFAVEFLNVNTFLTGSRNGCVNFFDIRCKNTSQTRSIGLGIRHKSSVTNFGLIGDYYLIVAGLENSLNMYDIRMTRPVNDSFSQSVLSFNGHVNEYSFGYGFSISCNKRVVAAAGQDRVCFWSTLDGKLLRKKPMKFNASRALKFCQTSTKWFEELCIANETHLEWWSSN